MTLQAACRALVISTLLGLSSVLAGCASGPAFEAPTHEATAQVAPPVPDSEIAVAARLPYAELRQIAASQVPASTPVSGLQQIACAPVPSLSGGGVGSKQVCTNIPYCDAKGCGVRPQCAQVPTLIAPTVVTTQQCANFGWQATIRPEGAVTLQKAGDALHIEQPVRIDGQGGVGGDLSRIMAASPRSFQAHLVPGADLKFNLDANWCPVIQITPTQRWVSNASVEVMSKTCVGVPLGPFGNRQVCAGPAALDLTAVANANMHATQDALIKSVQSALSCDKVRTQLAAVWRTTAIPLADLGGAKAYLNLTPTTAALSELLVDNDQIRFVAKVGVQTVISPIPVPTTQLTLPPLGRATPEAGGLDLNIQAVAPYSLLKSALAGAMVGKTFVNRTVAGEASVRIDDVDIYASKDGISVGLKLAARLPGRVLDDSGWVYLAGRPTALPDGRTLSIQDLRYAVVLKNPILKLVVATFNGQILAELNQHSSFDLTDVINTASAQIVNGLNTAPVQGVSFHAGKADIALKSVAVGPDGVFANAAIRVPLDVTLTRSLLPH